VFSFLPAIDDGWFYVAAVLVVLIVGVAKGGLAGGIGLVGVPLMSLTIEPARAAAILLPILMLMDLTALRLYWRQWDTRTLSQIAPGALLGTALGFISFDFLSPNALRILVGAIALVYSLRWWFTRADIEPRSGSLARGTAWATLSGFTSFSVHAGGPPLHVYLLSRGLDKTRFQATTVAFFFALNWLKLGPYAWLGQLDTENLATSLMLAPVAPMGIVLGKFLHHRVKEVWFFRVVYASLLAIGAKLIQDGLSG